MRILYVRQSKVSNLQITIVVEKQVLRLQVSVHDGVLVKVDDARDDLTEELACLRLGEPLLLDDVVEQLAALSVLHDKVERLRSLDDLIQLDYVRMFDEFKNLDLASHSLDIALVDDAVLLEYLDGHLLTRKLMNTQFDFTKGTFADCLLESVVADFVWFNFFRQGLIVLLVVSQFLSAHALNCNDELAIRRFLSDDRRHGSLELRIEIVIEAATLTRELVLIGRFFAMTVDVSTIKHDLRLG